MNYETFFNMQKYNLIDNKLLKAYGLALNAYRMCFDTNETFSLRDMTVAYMDNQNNTIHVNVDQLNTSPLDNETYLLFLILHEISHGLLCTNSRRGNRDHLLFNVASDFEIHNMLVALAEIDEQDNSISTKLKAIAKYIKSSDFQFLFDEEFFAMTAEEIYSKLQQKMNSNQMTMKVVSQQNQNQNGGGGDSDSQSKIKNQCQGGGGSCQGKGENGNDGEDGEDGQGGGGDDYSQEDGQGTGDGGNQKDGEDGQGGQDEEQQGNGQNGQGQGDMQVIEVTYNGKTSNVVNSQESKKQSKESQEGQDRLDQSMKSAKALLEGDIKQHVDITKGEGSCKAIEFLKNLFKVEIDWSELLQSCIATMLRKDALFSWCKQRPCSIPLGLYLPASIEDETGIGTIILAVDESGSITTEDIEKACAIILDSKEFFKKIIVLKHDDGISYEKSFVVDEDDLSTFTDDILVRRCCGGTSHKEVFQYVSDYNDMCRYVDDDCLSIFISLTDGYSDIVQNQSIIEGIPTVYITDKANKDVFNGVVCESLITI